MNEETRTDQDNTTQQTQCRQCGTCCRKGGPALHLEDLPLVESGKIPLKALFTIRQSEPAFDNVHNSIAPAVTDIIKIKSGRRLASACYFYEPRNRHCGQYDARPEECQTLKCWDTADIEKLYNCRRLTRRHILSRVEGLWDLITDHQDRCDYGHIADLAERVRRTPDGGTAWQELLELIRFDANLRQLTIERMKMDPEMQDFLYGRPLSFTIQMFRIRYADDSLVPTADGNPGTQPEVCYRRNGF